MRKIYFVGGGKGGVGKSTVSIALIDFLLKENKEILLVETDTSNPDVGKIFSKIVPVEAINLDFKEGWINLINKAEEHADKDIVINSAARNNIGLVKYGAMLCDALEPLDRQLDTIWVINRQRDSLNLLVEYMNTIGRGRISVLRNLYFGTSDKFELFNNSKVKKTIEEERAGNVLDFPDLADRITDIMTEKRLSFDGLYKDVALGDRIEIDRFRGHCREIFEQLVEDQC